MNQAPLLAPSHPALSPPEARLLLLLSRPTLSATQQDRARDLVPQVGDWPALIDTAWRKYVLPMVYQNLAGLEQGAPAEDVFAIMRPEAVRVTSEMLRWHAAFDWFHERCVLASGVPYAYFKGRALAARFYPDPVQRMFRDVDILVPPDRLGQMLRGALDQGCKVFLKNEPGTELDLSTDDKVAEFLYMNSVPSVLMPQGLLVEIHGEIDQHTRLFCTDDLLRAAQETATHNHHIKVLPDAAHVTFICYHHTRHLWSKLNWLADLGAICAHPEFNRAAVLDHARRLKLESTVAATLEFHELASKGLHPADLDRVTPGSDLLRACVDGLVGDDELEAQMRRGQVLKAFSFKWQEMPVSRWRFLQLKLREFKPVYADFRALPGGSRARLLRYVLAAGFRIQRYAIRRLQGFFGR